MSAKNLNISIRIEINSGSALLLYLASFFGLILLVKASPAVQEIFLGASTALTGAFAGFLLKRNSYRKIEVEKEKVQLANGHRKEDPLT